MSTQGRSLRSAKAYSWKGGELVVGVLLVFCVAGALLALATLLGGPAPTNAHPYIANNPGQATLRFGIGTILLAVVFWLLRRARRRSEAAQQSEPNTPHFARRFYRRMMLLAMPGTAALFAMAFLTGSVHRLGFLVGLGAFLAVVAAISSLWIVGVGRWERRLVQRLRAADCKLCPRCGYDLTGHDGPTNCPECGSALELGEVMKVWQSFRPRFSSERV